MLVPGRGGDKDSAWRQALPVGSRPERHTGEERESETWRVTITAARESS